MIVSYFAANVNSSEYVAIPFSPCYYLIMSKIVLSNPLRSYKEVGDVDASMFEVVTQIKLIAKQKQ